LSAALECQPFAKGETHEKVRLLLLVFLLALSAAAQDKTKPTSSAPPAHKPATSIDEASIRQLYEGWAKAFRAKDVNAIMAFYAPGDAVVAYDIIPPLQYKGFDTYKKGYTDFLAPFKGPIEVEFRDMHVYAGGDVVHCLERITGTMQSGQKVDFWLRVTSGLRKIKGKWLIVHDHISVPADFDTGKAAMDLKP
jgi:ketosteroid isomerase-like protein